MNLLLWQFTHNRFVFETCKKSSVALSCLEIFQLLPCKVKKNFWEMSTTFRTSWLE